MKRMLLFMLLCSMCDVFSSPRKRREVREQQVRELQNLEIAQEWQKQHLLFINPETQRPYSSSTLTFLAILCGPAIMLSQNHRSTVELDQSNRLEVNNDLRFEPESKFTYFTDERYQQAHTNYKAKCPSSR